jgi:hypothetical protein
MVDDTEPGVVDAIEFEYLLQERPSCIGAQRTDEGGAGAGASGGDHLVEAFAAGVLGIRVTEDGLAGRGRASSRRDQIEVGAADNADVEHRRRP